MLVVRYAQPIYLSMLDSFYGLRSLLIVGKERSDGQSRLDLSTFAITHPLLEELGFSDATMSLHDESAQGIRPCLRLTRLHLRKCELHFESSSLQRWAPNLEVLVSYNSEPDKNFYLSLSILSFLPPKLRQIVYVESFTSLWLDFVNFRPVNFSPTLELLHLIGHAETNRRGQLSVRDADYFSMMRDRVGACTGGPSLDIKLEWASNRKKSADELYEEIAERYKLLR